MEQQRSAPAWFFPRRPDGTFGDAEPLEDLTIRVYSGGELKAEATLQDLTVRPHSSGELNILEVEEELRADEELRAEESAAPEVDPRAQQEVWQGMVAPPDHGRSHTCQVQRTGQHTFRCLTNTCQPTNVYGCDQYTVSFPGGDTLGICICRIHFEPP